MEFGLYNISVWYYIGYTELFYKNKNANGLGFIYNFKERDFLIKFTTAEFDKGELTF